MYTILTKNNINLLMNRYIQIKFKLVKNVPILKHLVLIVELIQQRRKFKCEEKNSKALIGTTQKLCLRENSTTQNITKL